MCRYSDDYDWYVEDTDNAAVAETDRVCEDCRRVIAAGEAHTVYTAMPDEDEEHPYIFVAQRPEHRKDWSYVTPRGVHVHYSFDEANPWFPIDEGDSDVWEALGFAVFEEDPGWEPSTSIHVSCSQCVIAGRWLDVICHQNSVLDTRVDLEAHTDEYDSDTLGPAFMRLVDLALHGWRDDSVLVSTDTVRSLTETAIEHAKAAGLDGNH